MFIIFRCIQINTNIFSYQYLRPPSAPHPGSPPRTFGNHENLTFFESCLSASLPACLSAQDTRDRESGPNSAHCKRRCVASKEARPHKSKRIEEGARAWGSNNLSCMLSIWCLKACYRSGDQTLTSATIFFRTPLPEAPKKNSNAQKQIAFPGYLHYFFLGRPQTNGLKKNSGSTIFF